MIRPFLLTLVLALAGCTMKTEIAVEDGGNTEASVDGHAEAGLDGGSQCPTNPNNVQTGVACSAAGATCMGYSPCALTFVQCSCNGTSWDCGSCGGDGGVCSIEGNNSGVTFDIATLGIAEAICAANATDCTLCPQAVNGCHSPGPWMRLPHSGCACPPPPMQTGSCGDGGTTNACIGSINDVNRATSLPGANYACPTTYAQAVANPPSCGAGPSTETLGGQCGDDLVFHADCQLHGFVCVYDGTTRDLKGMAAYDDTPRYCGQTASCIQWGQLAPGVSCGRDGLRVSCPLGPVNTDGGVPGDGGSCITNADCPSGKVCSYDQGCATISRSCQDDTSGDAVALHFCGCDGQTFTTNQAHPTQPWSSAGDCGLDGGGNCPADPNTVQSGVVCSAPAAVCTGYSPCAETFVQCTCNGTIWDCGDCQAQSDSGTGPACGSTTCAVNQVCVHPCTGIPLDGGGNPPPYCVDIPTSCHQGTCDCVRPGACPNTGDAGPSGAPSCSDTTPGQLYCNGCA